MATKLDEREILLEARVGIEPTHKGFADLSLTTWVPRLYVPSITKFANGCVATAFCLPQVTREAGTLELTRTGFVEILDAKDPKADPSPAQKARGFGRTT